MDKDCRRDRNEQNGRYLVIAYHCLSSGTAEEVFMAYQATAYNVMIASPNDVAAERNAVRTALNEWNTVHSENRGIVLLPLGWESHATPEMGDHPQSILNKQILTRGDLLVGVFWTRLGTPTPRYPSGSVEEIEEHIASGKPAMLYFSNQPVRPDSVNQEQYTALLNFKNSCQQRGLYQEFASLTEFAELFYRHLQMKVNTDAYFQKSATASTASQIVEHASVPNLTISSEARHILKAATASNGMVMKLGHLGGATVSAGSQTFVEGNDRRAIALWEGAVVELEKEGLIEDKAGKGELYFVTNAGYLFADSLPNE